MRSINGSINGQLLQAVVVVNRPPFRGALTPASRTAGADAALGAACSKQNSPILRATFCRPHKISAIMGGTLPPR